MNCQYTPDQQFRLHAITRRHFFSKSAWGIGGIALASLLNDNLFAAGKPEAVSLNPLAPKAPHFAPKAKRVIYMFMEGAPSQLDLFDYKPKLVDLNMQPCPEEMIKGERFAFIQGIPKILGTSHQFARHGKCGMELSELLPNLATVADDITLVRSMVTDAFNHAPAQIFLNTGSTQIGRPSMGSWLNYGLGSIAQNLPGFVVMTSGGLPSGGTACWSSGFLPTVYQGVQFRSQGDPVLFLSNPAGMTAKDRRRSLDALHDLNEMEMNVTGDPEIATRINAFELAFKMQTSAPELMDISSEPKAIHEMYGTEPGKVSFANNCLLARRLIERGTRFVQLYDRSWDHHGVSMENDVASPKGGLATKCREADRPMAALIKDLKQRGLLDETLVIWGGEFGRTPLNEARGGSKFLGRDHHPRAFSLWMAGGGIKAGYTHGATDDFGWNVAEDRVHVHDLQATILHCLGLDHTRLTYKFQGRNFRLTEVAGEVVKKILA
jgi:hypothetical protein